jgi:hypothetical protein
MLALVLRPSSVRPLALQHNRRRSAQLEHQVARFQLSILACHRQRLIEAETIVVFFGYTPVMCEYV